MFARKKVKRIFNLMLGLGIYVRAREEVANSGMSLRLPSRRQ